MTNRTTAIPGIRSGFHPVKIVFIIILLSALAAFPFVSGNRFYISLITEMMIYGLLAIGRALISNPRIIIIDEPSQGLSPLLVQTITDVVLKFCVQSGITLLIVEQNYQMALKVPNRHYLMDTRGEIVNNLTTRELENNPEIIQSHLSV
ncbi:MAG TPA: hypothetical protein DCR95_04850 [Desulfobacter sp.]|uniref:hypothetical protein n=1 Tax=Desulfobacter sp. UBA2225 TaxID=1961413 RepID=UPI000E914540|nr:hypothetical protein [Desulfobacter sp. UBA2225]HAR33422.1 hypothetical protein [Desulfobacter sp.]